MVHGVPCIVCILCVCEWERVENFEALLSEHHAKSFFFLVLLFVYPMIFTSLFYFAYFFFTFDLILFIYSFYFYFFLVDIENAFVETPISTPDKK